MGEYPIDWKKSTKCRQVEFSRSLQALLLFLNFHLLQFSVWTCKRKRVWMNPKTTSLSLAGLKNNCVMEHSGKLFLKHYVGNFKSYGDATSSALPRRPCSPKRWATDLKGAREANSLFKCGNSRLFWLGFLRRQRNYGLMVFRVHNLYVYIKILQISYYTIICSRI